MASISTPLMTAEEFFEWASRPENQDKYCELERGEIVPMPPPGEIHGILCAWIAYLLWTYVLKRGQGRVASNDMGLIVARDPDTVRGPDIMLFAESRRLEDLSPRYPDQLPLLIVEVLSPSDNWGKTLIRVGQYLKRGVALVWVVDPDSRTVSVHRRGQDLPAVRDEMEDLTGEDVLPDFRCRVAELFTFPGTKPDAAAPPNSGANPEP
jgi:Uma2 family endonuclease